MSGRLGILSYKPLLWVRLLTLCAAVVCICACILPVYAQDQQSTTEQALSEYRESIQDENPGDLYVAKGQSLWLSARGPKSVSMVGCDLGLGPGVIKGAWTALPRYFRDTDEVQDLESRILTCMQALQGFDTAKIKAADFSYKERLNITLMALYVASESKGLPFQVPQNNEQERRMYKLGEALFNERASTHDFACASCHSRDGVRIRLQELPNLLTNRGAGFAFSTWPAYRVSTGSVWSMQERITDCFRQQRFPKPLFASPAITALSVYMGVNAKGTLANAPGLKR